MYGLMQAGEETQRGDSDYQENQQPATGPHPPPPLLHSPAVPSVHRPSPRVALLHPRSSPTHKPQYIDLITAFH